MRTGVSKLFPYRRFLRWRTALLILGLIGLAGACELRFIGRQTLWVDELFSLAMATGHSLEHPAAEADAKQGDFVQAEHPVPGDQWRSYAAHGQTPANLQRVMRAVFLSDTSPPLYYLLLSLWTQGMGTTDIALRAFSVLWFLACIPLVVLIARRIGGPRAELGAGLLFIASPIATYYSTEGRMYSLLWFCVAAAAFLSLCLSEKKRSLTVQVLWVLASSAGLLVHYFFLFPWCAMVGFLFLRPGLDTRFRLAVRVLLTVLVILPWYQYLPASLHHWRITQDWLNWLPHGFNRFRAACDLALQFFSNDGHYLWWDHSKKKIVLLCAFGLLGLVMLFRLRTQCFARNRLLLWGWFAAACLGPLVFDLVKHSYTVAIPRYAISALPAAASLSALALAGLPRILRYGLLALIVVAWSSTTRNIYHTPWRNDQQFAKLGQALNQQATERDLVLVHSIPSGAIGVARYTQTKARFVDWIGQLDTRRVPTSITALSAGFQRIFFVRFHEVGAPAPEEAWLREHAAIAQETHFGLIVFVEFRPKHANTF